MKFSLCDLGLCRCRQIPKVGAEQYEDWSAKSKETVAAFRAPGPRHLEPAGLDDLDAWYADMAGLADCDCPTCGLCDLCGIGEHLSVSTDRSAERP